MTITALTLTNPGCETGNTTGWTRRVGTSGPTANTGFAGTAPHAGTYFFFSPLVNAGMGTNAFDQEIDISSYATAIDAGTVAVRFEGYLDTDGVDSGGVYVEFYDSGHVLLEDYLDESVGAELLPTDWTKMEIYVRAPVSARYVRVGAKGTKNAGTTTINTYWDDFAADISDDRETDWPSEFFASAGARVTHGFVRTLVDGGAARVTQAAVRVLANVPSEEARLTQAGARSLLGGGTPEARLTQTGVRLLIKYGRDIRTLRAWTFTQDDHDFYVLQIGNFGTLIYDKLTQQWAQWRSPGYAYWRGNDGVQWEGWNIACDSESGKLWIIDAEGRLDEGVTPITSVITGGLSARMRTNVPCFMAELTVSEGRPPSGVGAGDVSFTLRTSDDGGLSYLSHGSIPGEASGDDMTVRWYGLGLIPAPGKVFEITDTGYARRIDGLNVETPE